MQQAILTVDLGFGDAGKGSIVDYLARRHDAHTVVRYNGGAQAGHRVVTPGAAPQEHVFAQFGSGALAGAATHLSRFMLLDPLAMMVEAQHLSALGAPDPFAHTTIDAGALVITPFQRAANRLKELARGLRQAQSSRAGRHGSCGMGIGETQADFLSFGERVLFAGDLTKPAVLREKLEFLRAVNLAKAPAFPSDLAASTLIAPNGRCWLPPIGPTGCCPPTQTSRAARRSSPAPIYTRFCNNLARLSSKARRACCWTNGAVSTRTPPGAPPRWQTPIGCWARPATAAALCAWASRAPMPRGTARGRWSAKMLA